MSRPTRRRLTQGILATPTLAALAGAASAQARRRPNVLWVMADEWRAQAFGYAGDPNAHTPAFDRFAAESLNFEQAVSGCPVCSPARASLTTGQYPLTNGVYINDVPLDPKGVTLGESFRNAGYDTGYIGKWHLFGSPLGRFERRESYIPPEKRFGYQYWKAAETTHDYNKSFYYDGDDRTKKYWSGYDAIAQTEEACRYVREHARSQDPYFLVLSWGPPHFPLNTAPERYQDMYRNRQISVRPNVPEDKKSETIEDLRGYYAHIAALDDCFEKLLRTLETAGNSEDTIVLFTSDHGDMMGSQGLTEKLYPWEESIRVPLLIRYPRRFGRIGLRSQEPVNSPDIMPTLLGLSGIAVPRGVQGRDYSASPPASRRDGPTNTAFLNLPVSITTSRANGFAEYRGVRSRYYTYVRSIDGPWLLYDNQNDPYQKRNLCGDRGFAKIQRELESDLNRWLRLLGDQFHAGESYLKRDKLSHYLEPYSAVGRVQSPWGDWKSTMQRPVLSVDSPLGDLRRNPTAKSILLKELPELPENPNPGQMRQGWISLRLLHRAGLGVSEAKLNSIEAQLARIVPPVEP